MRQGADLREPAWGSCGHCERAVEDERDELTHGGEEELRTRPELSVPDALDSAQKPIEQGGRLYNAPQLSPGTSCDTRLNGLHEHYQTTRVTLYSGSTSHRFD